MRKPGKRYGVRGFPTVLFLSPQGKTVGRLSRWGKIDKVSEQMKRVARRWEAVNSFPENKGKLWDWIRDRIARLGDERLDVRDKATKELADLKRALAHALRLAERSDDPEVRARVRRLLGRDR